MKSRNLLLGLILLFIGVVALLDSMGIVDFKWRIAVHLWPILLIAAGVLFLPLKDWLKALLLIANMRQVPRW